MRLKEQWVVACHQISCDNDIELSYAEEEQVGGSELHVIRYYAIITSAFRMLKRNRWRLRAIRFYAIMTSSFPTLSR